MYVADFRSETLKDRSALLSSFTEQFEGALMASGSYIVLDRRKVDSLLRESKNEMNLSLQSLPAAARERIRQLENAQGVVFGQVIDDVDSGEVIITATLEKFDSVKQWQHTVVMKRGLVQDYTQRQQAMNRLVSDKPPRSASPAQVPASVDNAKPSQSAGANSQQIANSGTIGSVTYNVNAPGQPRKEVKIDPKLLDGYVGPYLWPNAYSVAVTITREGDRLYSQFNGQPKFELFAETDRDFFLKVVDAQVTFLDPGKDGKASGLILHQKMQDLVFNRADEGSPALAQPSIYTPPAAGTAVQLPAGMPSQYKERYTLMYDAYAKTSDCRSMASLWTGKSGQATSALQLNAINNERAAAYRSSLLPQLKDLQRKILKELGRGPNEGLNYDLVESDLQLLDVCSDFNHLTMDYRRNASLFQPR